ncbi:snurportin-1 [Musca vetustissima]|uniref:snurportin-1 n=1 Tax=Musca vetustissima TaxID=27455 RepID=UPI002AB6D967|nr:snurportin-1 [Musca vetustissima]
MYQDLYKRNIDKGKRQEIRRQQLLQEQKIKRLEQQDEQRVFREESKPSGNRRKYKQQTFQEIYGSDLGPQLSEWMREKPECLDDWLLVPCPKGQRCLVVSSRGKTRMFSKAGRFRMSFMSHLPGGGASTRPGSGFSILDCIYNPGNDTFYVLDVLWYGKQCFLDCETQFRFFWLKSKFDELEDEADERDHEGGNIKPFSLLKCCDIANNVKTAQTLQTYPLWSDNTPELDGFLFYHKEASYTCGPTPLVCWLFPFMVGDVLQMPVNSSYVPPPNYSSPWIYMDEFDKDLARRRHKGHTKQMDCYIDTETVNSSSTDMDGVQEEGEEDDTNEKEASEQHLMDEIKCGSLERIMNAERLLELEGITEM